MRKYTVFALLFLALSLAAQNSPTLTKGKVPLHNVFEPDSLAASGNMIYRIRSTPPLPAGIDEKIKYRAGLMRKEQTSAGRPSPAKRALQPVIAGGFTGALNEGTPNDNNLAVNNDSFVISVLNTFIRVYTTSGVFKKNWSLEFFPRDPANMKPGSGVGTLDRAYDPKILFDPYANRFILVYLEGSESNDTRIIVAYSKTSNPLNGWNVYQLNGNPFGGSLWTDYPMIAINGEDLFITVNILKDNTDWRDGFTQSVIWQLPKKRGYDGDTLMYNLWSDIRHNGKPIWNICPVQDAYQPGKPGMYFLSVMPGDASNDTVFLHSISFNYSHGNPAYSYKVLKTDKPYGLPPYAPQKQAGFRLQTNDARVLGAFHVNNRIQYVQTTVNPGNGRSSVYHGILSGPDDPAPTVKGNILSYDSLDIAYPTIAYAGNRIYGQQSLITFSHTGEDIFPGTSLVYHDNNGSYSDLLMLRKGEGYINSFIPDSAERWGDYTCIQRNYSNDPEFWIAGSFGKASNAVGTWISKVEVNDPSVGLSQPSAVLHELPYPNPVADLLTVPFAAPAQVSVTLTVTDAAGKTVFQEKFLITPGQQKAIVNTSAYRSGIYHYSIRSDSNVITHGTFYKY